MRERTAVAVLLALAMLPACAAPRVDAEPDLERARELIGATSGEGELQWERLSADELAQALADGLGLEEALRLALLNNRRLQAAFAGLGVARADFVQAGLLANPRLGLGVLFPTAGGAPKLALDLVQSLVHLRERPAREEAAARALERRILEVAGLAADLLADTKEAYFESVAAGELLATARESAALATASLEAITRRAQGGVATSTEQGLAKSQALSAELALLGAERERFAARRRLASLLSLQAELLEVTLEDGLPEARREALDREALVELARASRLDLRAAGAAVEEAEAELLLERARAAPALEAGVELERPERDSSADLLVGLVAGVELSIFDRNQVRIRRAEFRRDQVRAEHEALLVSADQAVRAAADRAAAAARLAAFVVEELLPQAEEAAVLAGTAFDLGDTTLLPLLEIQRAVLIARSSRVQALLEAAKARVELERALGRTGF